MVADNVCQQQAIAVHCQEVSWWPGHYICHCIDICRLSVPDHHGTYT